MYCHKCGKQMPENASFCPDCGECAHTSEQSGQEAGKYKRDYRGNDYTASFHPDDIERNKGISLVAYILFFVPLLAAPDSRFARFHANQGLIIFIVSLILNIMRGIFNPWNWWNWTSNWNSWVFNPFTLTINLLQFALLAAIIYGIVNAINGKAVEIPLIGKFRLIV